MSVVVAARKYLVRKLEVEALKGVHSAVNSLEYRCRESGDATLVLGVIRFLSDHKEHNPRFEDKIARLGHTHVSELFKLKEYRNWLETEEGASALALTAEAVTSGTEVAEHAKWSGCKLEGAKHARCMSCMAFWCAKTRNSPEEKCPDCSSDLLVPWDDGEV
jgi:hypothetical protein